MRNYRYKAKKGPREIVEGILTADTQDQALDKIHEMGLIPVDLTVQQPSSKQAAVSLSVLPTVRTVRSKDLAQFYRQLASLVKSGVPLVKALAFLTRENAHLQMKEITAGLEARVREGESLQEAFARYPEVFSAFDRGMIQTGERGGNLEEALYRVAKYRTDQEALRSKVVSALAYPALVIGVGILSMVFMLTHVVPQFSVFFAGLGQELPLPTRLLITISEWMKWGWLILAGVVVGGVLLFKNALKSPEKREAFHAWLLGLPQIGPLLLKSEIANLSRSLVLLLKSGIPLLNSLKAAVPVLTNDALRRELQKVHQRLEQGGYFSQGLFECRYFPAFFIHVVSVGEEAGRLEGALEEVADWYELETAEAICLITSLMEPVLILIVGLILGFMMVSILLPIFSMSAMVS